MFSCKNNNMTGVLLVSQNWAYSDWNGKVNWGPEADKEWLRNFIRGKKVFCGHNTFKSLPRSIIELADWQCVSPTEDCEVHFGGPKSFYIYPPKTLIIHQCHHKHVDGPVFRLPCYYRLQGRKWHVDYMEYIYEKE
jgi:hypothetical protein